MMRGRRLVLAALGAATCLAASSAGAQMVVGESRPDVEVNWSVLDRLGPEPTLPAVLTRKVPPPAKAAPRPVQKPVTYKPLAPSRESVAAVAHPPKPKTAKPAAVAVEKMAEPERPVPVASAPVPAPAPVSEPSRAVGDPVKIPVSAQDRAQAAAAQSPPARPAKPDMANDVAPPAKPDRKPDAAPGAVQFAKVPEPPVSVPPPVPVVAPPVPPAVPVAPPMAVAPPPAPVVPVTPPPAPVVQAPPPQVAAVQPAAPVALRKGDNASVAFAADSSHLPDSARSDLERVAQKMDRDENLSLQLLAYAPGDEANASKARRLSLSRALEVRKYLMEMGVRSTRIEVRALGNKIEGSPADRVDVVLSTR